MGGLDLKRFRITSLTRGELVDLIVSAHPVALENPHTIDPKLFEGSVRERLKDAKRINEEAPWLISIVCTDEVGDYASTFLIGPDREHPETEATIVHCLIIWDRRFHKDRLDNSTVTTAVLDKLSQLADD